MAVMDILALVGLGLLLYLLGGLWVVHPNERAVAVLLGNPAKALAPGLRFTFLPYPLTRLIRFNVYRKAMPITVENIVTTPGSFKRKGFTESVQSTIIEKIEGTIYYSWPRKNLARYMKIVERVDVYDFDQIIRNAFVSAVRQFTDDHTWRDLLHQEEAMGVEIAHKVEKGKNSVIRDLGLENLHVDIQQIIIPEAQKNSLIERENAQHNAERIREMAGAEADQITATGRARNNVESDKIRKILNAGGVELEAINALKESKPIIINPNLLQQIFSQLPQGSTRKNAEEKDE